jgi:diguanylate cyclase (GGDEF)-like protein
MNMRVLLVESEPEEAIFLQDVLKEIEDERHLRPWVHLEIMHAASLEEADAILDSEAVDVVLANPDLPESRGFETLRHFSTLFPHLPMVLLLGTEGEFLGLRLMREGAQDFLLRTDIDCAPLAHALRNAIARQRLVMAAQAARFRDPLTGIPNLGCFAMLADRDRRLAEKLGARWMVLLAEISDLDEMADAYGEQRRDLTLVETTELLRELISGADQLYRVGDSRFAITVFESKNEFLEQTLGRVERAVAGKRISIGASIFSPGNPASLDDLMSEARTKLVVSKAGDSPLIIGRGLQLAAGR